MSYLREKLPEFSPAVVELEPWRKALMDAAEYMRVHGHCRGALEDGAGQVCVIGALHKTRCRGKALIEAASHLCGHIGGGTIGDWSDRTPTSDVIATLDAAARS